MYKRQGIIHGLYCIGNFLIEGLGQGTVCFLYNKYGYMYCSENVSGGNVTVREFYDRNGDIKVIEQTGSKTYTCLLYTSRCV